MMGTSSNTGEAHVEQGDQVAQSPMKVVYSLRHRSHHPLVEIEASGLQEPHEHPGRAEKIRERLAADPAFSFIPPDEHGVETITAVHDPGLVSFLETAWMDYQAVHAVPHHQVHDVVPDLFAMSGLREGLPPHTEPDAINARLGYYAFETTTPITQGTYDAARSSVDVALTAADLALQGKTAVYGLCRPPGHHATRGLYGGYCFFNNAAIATQYLVDQTGERVAILDVDYHHGNGTQAMFYDRPDVFFASLHGDPIRAYPYFTGHAEEVGTGRGRGTNLNVPLAVAVDDDTYLTKLAQVCEAVVAFKPELIVVSLGLDTYEHDPLSDLALTTGGLRRCGELMQQLGIPTVVVQEGGYATEDLGKNAASWLRGLGGRAAADDESDEDADDAE